MKRSIYPFIAYFLCILVSVHSAVYYVDSGSAGTGDGLSWAAAKNSIGAATQIAAVGDEVWVKAGTYGRVGYVYRDIDIYGGFNGTETELGQRDWITNKTYVDGQRGVSSIFEYNNVSGNPRIDGFEFINAGNGRDGSGGAVNIYATSLTIANCRFIESKCAQGGALCMEGGGVPLIYNCEFIDCWSAYGGAVKCRYTHPIFQNCMFWKNSSYTGGAIRFQGANSAKIRNCVFYGNIAEGPNGGTGGAIYDYVDVANSIFWNNTKKTREGVSSIDHWYSNYKIAVYCVFEGGQTGTGTLENIFTYNPLFVNAEIGDFHLQEGSPCIDAGSNDAGNLPDIDFDSQSRYFDGDLDGDAGIDIGADEWETVWQPYIWYVDGSQGSSGDGTSWTEAFVTIEEAMAVAKGIRQDQIWIKSGNYLLNSQIVMGLNLELYGGFTGTETALEQRNIASNPTTLDGQNAGFSIVKFTGDGVLDGLRLQNGKNMSETYPEYSGGGVTILDGNVVIRNCHIRNNSTGNLYTYGGGIYVDSNADSVLIEDCEINNNEADRQGGGIYIYATDLDVTIRRCRIADNNLLWFNQSGGGIFSNNTSGTTQIQECEITGNSTHGIYVAYNSGAQITNCLFDSNKYAGIKYSTNSAPLITNCTIVNAIEGPGIYNENGSSDATVKNCIVWANDNSNQIYNYGGTAPTVIYSCVDQDGYGNADGSADAGGNIRFNPLFIDSAADDYMIGIGSPCIDAGTSDGSPEIDIDGRERPLGDMVDIGAYEYDGPIHNGPWYVDGSAAVAGFGTSWSDPMKSIANAALVAKSGQEVWIKAAQYDVESTIEVTKAIKILGGFAGDETSSDQRKPAANPTILKGNGAVRLMVIKGDASLDGLILQNGKVSGYLNGLANAGAAVYNDGASVLVSNCVFTGNQSGYYGGALYSYLGNVTIINSAFFNNSCPSYGGCLAIVNSSLSLINCLFSGNNGSNGGAIYASGSGNPMDIVNCTFAYNISNYGGAMSVNSALAPVISNSIFWGNTGASAPTVTGTSSIVSNCIMQDGYGGSSNADPLFADHDGPDNDIATWQDNMFMLGSASPAIDAGDNTAIPADIADLDRDGDTDEKTSLSLYSLPRFVDVITVADTGINDAPDYPEIADIGAFEYIPGDIVPDAAIDNSDAAAFSELWGQSDCGDCSGADLDGDNDVDIDDLVMLIGFWMTGK